MKNRQTVKRQEKQKTVKGTISISAKCSDLFSATVQDKTGTELFYYEGYVPGFFPEEHFGDYVMLDIDLETGKILNWKPPTKEQLESMQTKDCSRF